MKSINQTIVFTNVEQKRGFFSIIDNQLHLAAFDTHDSRDMDRIFVGRVANILPNLKAAFVEYRKGVFGFLPLKKEALNNLKCETYLPVQVVKDAVKTKEAVLSTELSLNGIYCVVTNQPGGLTFSRKIPARLREDIADCCKPYITDDLTYIIRTNAIALMPEEYTLMTAEITQLKETLEAIMQNAQNRTVYSKLYDGAPFAVSQLSKTDFTKLSRLVTDSQIDIDQISHFLPASLLSKVSLYEDASFPLSALYSLRGKLQDAVSRTVWLKSGGYLVIEPTEALTVIDVNSGKNQKKMSKKDLSILTNTEAAEVIPYLLTSRNLSGIIIVDFINVDIKSEEEKLLKLLRSYTAADYIKTDVVDMTPLGLVEITRQKKDIPLKDQLCEVGIYEAIRH
jgi:ribonuclease G